MLVGKGAKAGKKKPTNKRDPQTIKGEVKSLLEDLVTKGLLDEVLWGERKDIRASDIPVANDKRRQREIEYIQFMHEFDYVIDESIYDTNEWTLFLLQHLLNIDYKVRKIELEMTDASKATENSNRLSFITSAMNDIREKVVADINVPVPQTEVIDEEMNAFFITDENEKFNQVEDKEASQRRLYRQYIPEYTLLTYDAVFTVFWGEVIKLNSTVSKLLHDFNDYENKVSSDKFVSKVETTQAAMNKNEGGSRVTANKGFRRSAEDILNRLKYSCLHSVTGDAAGAAVSDDPNDGANFMGFNGISASGGASATGNDTLDSVIKERQDAERAAGNVSVVKSSDMDIIESKEDLDSAYIESKEDLDKAMVRSRWRELTKWIREEATEQKTANCKSNRRISAAPKYLKDLFDRVKKHRIPMTHIWSESLSSQAAASTAPIPTTDAENGDYINMVVPGTSMDNGGDFLSFIDTNIRKKKLKKDGIPVRYVLTMNTRKIEYTNYFPETLVNEMVTYDEIVSSLCVLQSSEVKSAGIGCSVIGNSDEERSYRLMDRYGRVDAITLGGTIDDRIEKSRAFHIHITKSFASQDTDDDIDIVSDAYNPNHTDNADYTNRVLAVDTSIVSHSHSFAQDVDVNYTNRIRSGPSNNEVDGNDRKRVVTQRIVDLELAPHVSALSQIRWNESNTRIICERNKTGRQPKVQRVLIRYPIRNFGQEFEEVIYDPETYLVHIFSTRHGSVVSHNIVHVSSVYVTRSLFYDMVTIRTKSQLINSSISSNGYLGTIRADYWNLLINEIHHSIHGRANQHSDRVKDIRDRWKGTPVKDTLYRDSQSLMHSRLVDARLSTTTDEVEKSKHGLVSDEADKWPDHSRPLPSDKTIFALKVDKKTSMSMGMSQPSFVEDAGECMTDDATNSVSTLIMEGFTAKDVKGMNKITTLTMSLAASDYSRAGNVCNSPRNKFIPQLPASHNISSKTKSPVSNRSKHSNKQISVAENVFALQGTAPVYHEYPRSSPIDVRTPKKKQFVVTMKTLDIKAATISATENSNVSSVGQMPTHSNLFTPVQLQDDSLDAISHYLLSKNISPPILPIDSNLDDHLLLLIESRTIYQHYFCEKFQILDVVCDPCITFYDASDLLADSPLSYDVIFISLNDLMECQDMKRTLNALNPGRVYSIVVYGAFGATPNIEETMDVLHESGVSLFDEPYALLDMKKLMQKLRKGR